MLDSRPALDDPTKAFGGLLIFIALCWFVVNYKSLYEEFQTAHRRGALLKAYRSRRRWRKADVPKLRKLGVCAAAEKLLRRLEGEKGRGRGVVSHYRSPDDFLSAGAKHFDAFLAPETAPHDRLKLLKKIPLVWPYLVEALYRGEHSARKAAGAKAASDVAAQVVAGDLGLSYATVRKLCTKVRQERGEAFSDFPALTLNDFGRWQQTGDLMSANASEMGGFGERSTFACV
jgi:hypothetical protein